MGFEAPVEPIRAIERVSTLEGYDRPARCSCDSYPEPRARPLWPGSRPGPDSGSRIDVELDLVAVGIAHGERARRLAERREPVLLDPAWAAASAASELP